MKKRSTLFQSSRLRWSQKSFTHQAEILPEASSGRRLVLSICTLTSSVWHLSSSAGFSRVAPRAHISPGVIILTASHLQWLGVKLQLWSVKILNMSVSAAAGEASGRTEGDHKVNLLLKPTFVFFRPERKQIHLHTDIYSAFRSWMNTSWLVQGYFF